MSDQPSGTVTFLFTDIEGSTKRWERQPEAMAKALVRHDELMREAIAQHNGHVFKTIGDAFCAVFPTAHDAVAAALTAQRAIAGEPWGEIGSLRVRMGLHTGEAQERDADYFGPTVNRVARIASAGHGGQALLSSITGEHVEERLPSDVRLRSLGKHRLKDLARPERILQLLASGLPSDFPRLKTVPSPTTGMVAALISILVALVSFRLSNRDSSEGIGPALLSPLSLYTGLKGLIIELSTLNEYGLLAVGFLFLLLAVAIAAARWRAVRREQRRPGDDPSRFSGWVVNQRTVAFLAALALLVLGAYGYQQYLWRVSLPIPEDALGIAMTREASAATVKEKLADALYTQGQAEQVVIRELPVVFDARDTDRARELGKRIGAKAVIIYRAEESGDGGDPQYLAYVVFTDPNIGLALGGSPDPATAGASPAPQSVQVNEGIPVPVLQTETLDELVNAAAGIIAFDDNQPRKAIEHLRLAMPVSPDAPNTGIVNFYLGNAYNLDGQVDEAAAAYERASSFYERRLEAGGSLGPQDQLILVKTYMERGELTTTTGDWQGALTWYERGLGPRAEVVARAGGLERPTDVHATYARLYTLMADAYRFLNRSEDQRSWESRAIAELDALIAMADPEDAYALVQESAARFFMGDCRGARQSAERAIALDPEDIIALNNAGIIALFQDRPDIARAHWSRMIDVQPEDVTARQLIADSLILAALGTSYVEPFYVVEAQQYYRDIIALDPTNISAHQRLANITTLLAQWKIMDATALLADDQLPVARSQVMWPLDSARRSAAIETLAQVIEERRILASELQPRDPSAEADVADAYLERLMLIYSALATMELQYIENPDEAAMGAQMLADSEQVRQWTGQVFSNPAASRLDTLRAWKALAESLEREWSWYAFFASDEAKTATIEQEHRQVVADALAFGEAEPIAGIDEIAPLRILYFKAAFIAEAWDEDTAASATYRARIDELTQLERERRAEGISHYATFCTEVREQEAGDVLVVEGDHAAAQVHYETALASNPEHVDSLLGLAQARYLQGDIDGALTHARAATEAESGRAETWARRAFYSLAAADPATAAADYEQFFSLVGADPPQVRMATVAAAFTQLELLVEEHPEQATGLAELLPTFSVNLDGLVPATEGGFQYSALYGQLGELALFADQAALAEPLFRRSLQLDSYQPGTHANLVLSILAQGRAVGPEVEAALAMIEDPLWARISGYEEPEVLLGLMEDKASAYLDRFPDRQTVIEQFRSTVSGERDDRATSQSGIDGNTFTSRAYPFTVTWDSSWSVNESSSEAAAKRDVLQLTNGVATIQFTTTTTDSADAEACLNDVIAEVGAGEGWSTVTPALDAEGQPLAGIEGGRAYAVFLDRLSGAPGDEFLYVMDCQSLGDPDMFVRTFVMVPAAMYEQQREAVNQPVVSIPELSADAADESSEDHVGSLPELDVEAILGAEGGDTEATPGPGIPSTRGTLSRR